jgi:hypothetical protein
MSEEVGRLGVRVPPAIAAAFALVIQVLVAAVLFSIISAGAIFLNFVTNFCEKNNLVPGLVVQGMRSLEFVLWTADVLCFVLLIVVEVRKFCITVWNGRGS